MYLKRKLDILLSCLLLLITLPLIILCFLISFLELKELPIFRHKRIGQYGKEINIYKIKTISSHQPILYGKKAQASKCCAIIRKYSLDELLQLINVLKNEMSLIGPRPVTKHEWDNFIFATEYEKGLVLSYKPGITGLWQVSGRNELSYQQRLKMDVKYCRRYLFKNDLLIIIKTVCAVFKATGC